MTTTAQSTAEARTRLTSPARQPWNGRAGTGTVETGSGATARHATPPDAGWSVCMEIAWGSRRRDRGAVLCRPAPTLAAARRGPRRAPAQEEPVHELGERLVGLDAAGADLAQAFRRDGARGLPDDPRQIDAVDDVLRERDEL